MHMQHSRSDQRRQLGLVSVSSLVIASMIGAGVFTTSGFLLNDLRNPWLVILAWICGGVIASLGALCYASLAMLIPESGGEYRFLSDLLHPAAGFIAGLISLLVGFSAPLALVAHSFADYLKPWIMTEQPTILSVGLILFFALAHGWRVRSGAWLQNLVVVVKVLLIIGFIGYGLSRIEFGSDPGFAKPFTLDVFAVSLVWISFSYSGWNAAVYIGGEVRNPLVNLPAGLLLGTVIVTLLYVGLNLVFVFAAPFEKLAGQLAVAQIAAEALGGKKLSLFVSAIIAIALATSASSLTMAGPRVYAQAAADGYLPSFFKETPGMPPRASIALQTVLALLLLLTSTFEALLTYVGFTLSLSTAATVLALILARIRKGASVRVIGWPFVPMIFVLITLAVGAFTVARRPVESLWGLGTMMLGFILWLVVRKPNHTFTHSVE